MLERVYRCSPTLSENKISGHSLRQNADRSAIPVNPCSDQAKIGIKAKIATQPRVSFFDLLGKC